MRTIAKIVLWILIVTTSVWAFLLYKPEKPPPGKTVVTFAVWGGVAEVEAWKALIADFETRHPDIQVKLQLIPMKYNEKILALLAADIAPDVFTVQVADMLPKGVLRPIDDFLANDPKFNPDHFLPGVIEAGKWRGKTYNVPSAISPLVLFYNVRHFAEAGLRTPNQYYREGRWNWQTFLDCCRVLVQRDKSGRVLRWAYRVYSDWILWLYASINGGHPFSPDFRRANLTDPKTVEGLQRVADLALVYHVSPQVTPEEFSGLSPAWQEFKRGRVSMMHCGPWMVARLRGMKDPYDVAPPPMEPGGRSIFGATSMTGIWAKSPHPKAAYQWLSYLWSEPARVIWSRLGFDLPALKSLIADKNRWLDESLVPAHFDVFYDIAEEVLQSPPSMIPVIPTEARYVVERDMWPVMRMGTKTAREALAEAQPEVQRILDETFGKP